MVAVLTEKKTDQIPIRYVKKVLGFSLWSLQAEILLSVLANRYTAVRSCHAVGKSFIAAIAMHTFLGLNRNSIVITTAPTYNQVRNILWREFRKIYNRSKANAFMPNGYGGLLNQTDFTIDEDWYAIGLSPRDTDEARVQGFHTESGSVLVIADESPGCSRIIIDSADTSLMVSPNAHMLQIGNPTESVGHFYECFKDPDYKKFKIPFSLTPNAKANKDVVPFLITNVWVERMRKKWGVDHPFYVTKVDANFTDVGINSIISLADVERAMNEETPSSVDGIKVMGVDVAGEGNDLSAIAKRTGNVMHPILTFNKIDTQELADWVEYELKQFSPDNVDRVIVNIDTIGIGKGVFDALRRRGYRNVRSVKVSRKPTPRKMRRTRAGEEEYKNKFIDDYYSLKEELWWEFREELAQNKWILPNDEELKSELIAPRWSPVNGKIQMEEKKKTVLRLGHSPDKADAIILATAKPRPEIRIV